MKIPLVGPSYQERSLPFDAQRTINLYPVSDQSGKEVSALYGTPGIVSFTSLPIGPVRGGFCAANGRAFFVSGSGLYEVTSAGTVTSRGTLLGSSGTVTMAENGVQLGICDGAYGYTLTYSSNAFARITDANFPSAGAITFLDGYFIVSKNGSGSFYKSELYDGTTWTALGFATAESSPDDLVRPFNAFGQLWLFGKTTTEIWTNTGASTFPFERMSGAKLEIGCLAKHSMVNVSVSGSNAIVWVGRDTSGRGVVYRTSGLTSGRRISTDPIERILQDLTNIEELVGYSYQEDGHVFYVITGGDLETSLVYDFSTEMWHERAYTNEFGQFEQHLGNCHIFAFGKHLIGSRVDGTIYEMSSDYYSDNGEEIVSERTYTHLSEEDKKFSLNRLSLFVESGVGLQSGQGSDPKLLLSISKDGARTWSDWREGSIGKAGEYRTRTVFRRFGVADIITFKVRISDPIRKAIIGSYLS